MAFIPTDDECVDCETVYPTSEGQYSSDGKFRCGNCISKLSMEVQQRNPGRTMLITRTNDPLDMDYSKVLEFASMPA